MVIKIDLKALSLLVKSHLVEMLLFVVIYVVAICNNLLIDESNFMILSLVAISLSYSLNNFFKIGKWRNLYYAGWLLSYLPLFFINDDWYQEPQAVIISTILSPLIVILSQCNRDNKSFVTGVLTLIVSLSTAILFSGIISLLVFAISQSLIEIFSIENDNFLYNISYIYSFIWYIIAPLFFFHFMTHPIKRKADGSTLINYILSPAILIYAAVLYVYILKALIIWELPKGGVAYLVFGFMIFTLFVKSLRERLEKSLFPRFFDNFSYIAIPILLLFWIGVTERISQYGFTEWRVYLVVCGIIMTICSMMFMTKKYANYYTVALLGFALYTIIAFIPNLSAKDIAYRSQFNRAVRYLEKLQFIDANGLIINQKHQLSDDTQASEYEKLDNAVDYVMDINRSAFKSYGVTKRSQIYDLMPDEIESDFFGDNNYQIYFYFEESDSKIDISDYNYIYDLDLKNVRNINAPNYYSRKDRGLNIYLDDQLYISIGFKELVEDKIADIIKTNNIVDPTYEDIASYEDDLMIFKNDSVMVIFDSLTFTVNSDDSGIELSKFTLDKVLK